MKPIHKPTMAAADVSRSRADEIIDWLRHYAEERIDSRLFDERRCVPPYVILDFGNRGILGMQIPENFGGLALRNADFLRVLEQLAAIDLSLASLVFIHNANGIRPIVGYATPAMREELLPLLAKGRELSAFALTEPVAGSNLPGIATVAVPDGQEGWRLRGAKRWNGSGWAGVVSVFARMAGEGERLGHVTGFVVRQGMPGLRVGPESLTMGVRSIMQNSIFFDDVPVRPVNVLGEVGRGMDVADEALLVARLCMGAMSLGAMKRLRWLDAPLRHSPCCLNGPSARQPDHTGRLQQADDQDCPGSGARRSPSRGDGSGGLSLGGSLHDRQDRGLRLTVGSGRRLGRDPGRTRLHGEQHRSPDHAGLPDAPHR